MRTIFFIFLCVVFILSGGSLEAKALDIYVPICFSCLVQWQPLAEITVLSSARVIGVPEGAVGAEDYQYQHTVHIDSILIQVNNDWVETGDEIVLLSHESEPLEEGQEYLTFINPFFDGRVTARINDDRTITPYQEMGGYLQDYNGYTVDRFVEVVNEMLIADIHNYSEINPMDIFDFEGTLINPDEFDVIVGNIYDFEGTFINLDDDDHSIRIPMDLLIGIVAIIICVNVLVILIVINRLKRRYGSRD